MLELEQTLDSREVAGMVEKDHKYLIKISFSLLTFWRSQNWTFRFNAINIDVVKKVLDFLCVPYYIYGVYRKWGDKVSPRTGRPKTDNPMSERLHIRVSPQEKDEIMKFSSESGYTLLELIRLGIEKVRGYKK